VSVTRATIVKNGLRGRCPNCGRRSLFAEGSIFTVNKACPACGLVIEKGDGAFLGPLVINYTVTAFVFVIPILLLHASGRLGDRSTLALAGAAGLLVPIAFYRASWGWWLATYFFFLPGSVPGNLDGHAADDE
jgi:uncharacterized protein (DUF983 family)